eukprot:g5784.t1
MRLFLLGFCCLAPAALALKLDTDAALQQPVRGGQCVTSTGETCRFTSCASGAECVDRVCVCGIGMCAQGKTCVPWKPPDFSARKPDAEKILCPVLAAMYNAGDLVPDEKGRVTRQHLTCALHSAIGCSPVISDFQAAGVVAYAKDDEEEKNRLRDFFTYMKGIAVRAYRRWWSGKSSPCDTPPVAEKDKRFLNIFKMESQVDVQHGFSTGVREGPASDPGGKVCHGAFPCEGRFKTFFEDFRNEEQPDRLYEADILRLICHAKHHGDRQGEFSNMTARMDREWQMKAAFDAWLAAFGARDDESGPDGKKTKGPLYISLKAAREMLMEGHYPTGWVRRPWGTLKRLIWLRKFRKLPCKDRADFAPPEKKKGRCPFYEFLHGPPTTSLL